MGTIGNTADTLLLSLELVGTEEVESVDDPVTTLAEVTVRHLDASGSARLLGHEDVDLFTFLPAPSAEGLQVLNRRNMKWIRLSAPRGTIVLNSGDYMQRISNDIFPSTTHRVGKPRDVAQRRTPRVSFPMAVYVWEDEMLEVLPCIAGAKYPPVRAIEFHTAITSKFYGDGYAVK